MKGQNNSRDDVDVVNEEGDKYRNEDGDIGEDDEEEGEDGEGGEYGEEGNTGELEKLALVDPNHPNAEHLYPDKVSFTSFVSKQFSLHRRKKY